MIQTILHHNNLRIILKNFFYLYYFGFLDSVFCRIYFFINKCDIFWSYRNISLEILTNKNHNWTNLSDLVLNLSNLFLILIVQTMKLYRKHHIVFIGAIYFDSF